MLNPRNYRRNEEGQTLLIVIGVVAFTAILIFALQVSVIGDQQLSASSTTQEQALQAAQTGLSDYQARVNGSPNQWQYATAFCSSGAFPSPQCTHAPNPTQNPDPGNPAFSGVPDPNCTTSAANQTQGSPGASNYFGWVTVHNDAGFVQQFQYVVDTSNVIAPTAGQTLDPAGGGYLHIFVTGRSGRSGHFVCSTVKALYNGPQYTNANTTVLSPVLCNGSNGIITVPAPILPLADPNQLAQVVITATGGNGATGGVGSGAGGQGLQGGEYHRRWVRRTGCRSPGNLPGQQPDNPVREHRLSGRESFVDVAGRPRILQRGQCRHRGESWQCRRWWWLDSGLSHPGLLRRDLAQHGGADGHQCLPGSRWWWWWW